METGAASVENSMKVPQKIKTRATLRPSHCTTRDVVSEGYKNAEGAHIYIHTYHLWLCFILTSPTTSAFSHLAAVQCGLPSLSSATHRASLYIHSQSYFSRLYFWPLPPIFPWRWYPQPTLTIAMLALTFLPPNQHCEIFLAYKLLKHILSSTFYHLYLFLIISHFHNISCPRVTLALQLLIPITNWTCWQNRYYTHFTDDDTEVERDEVTCISSDYKLTTKLQLGPIFY